MSRWRVLALEIADWSIPLLIGIISALRVGLKPPPNPPVGVLASLHADLIAWYFWIVVGLSIAALVTKIALKVLRSESKIKIKAVLDALRDSYFEGAAGDERHHNRVTLFRPDRSQRKLKRYCRSGTQWQRSGTSFKISDDNEHANEGVAGQAWFSDATVSAQLPAPTNPWDDNHADCIAYAEAGYLLARKACDLNVKSRSILATPVRDTKGARWGILVLDSRTPNGLKADRQAHAELVATTIGSMI